MSRTEITERRRFPDGTETYIEVRTEITMVAETTTRTRVYRGVPEVEYGNCFCCSCDDNDMMISTDWLCRNHGYGFGLRPCEVHGNPGQTIEDPDTGEDTGEMPESVQVKRAADKKARDEWKAKHGG